MRQFHVIAADPEAARRIARRLDDAIIPNVHKNLGSAFASRRNYPQPNRYNVYTVVMGGSKGYVSSVHLETEQAPISEYVYGAAGLAIMVSVFYIAWIALPA